MTALDLLTLDSMEACITSIRAHQENLTARDTHELNVLYARLLTLQGRLVGALARPTSPRPVVIALYALFPDLLAHAQTDYQAVADYMREHVLLPFCRQHGLLFLRGDGGGPVFIDPRGATIRRRLLTTPARLVEAGISPARAAEVFEILRLELTWPFSRSGVADHRTIVDLIKPVSREELLSRQEP